MPEKSIYDILIVGGGLVGASLACALREMPLKIAIIEAAPWFTQSRPPSYDDRVIALSYASQRIFSGLGLWQQIALEATPIRSIHVSDQGHFGMTRLDHRLLNAPALGYVVSARHLGQSIQKMLASSTIEILAPAQLLQVHSQDSMIEVEIDFNQQRQKLQSRLLVAADGGRSKIRQQAGMTTYEKDYQQTAVIANVTLEYPHQNTAYERFTRSGPLALLPMQGHDCSLVWTVARENAQSVMALDDAAFLKALQQQFGWRLGRFTRTGQRHAYPLHLVQVQQLIRPRIVVIGNAAHTLHPVAGQGFNLGLRDVASLAEIIADSSRQALDLGNEQTLQSYVTRQKPDQERMITITDRLVQLFSNVSPPLVIARHLGLLITEILPPLKKQLVYQMAGLKGTSSRLIRGLPL